MRTNADTLTTTIMTMIAVMTSAVHDHDQASRPKATVTTAARNAAAPPPRATSFGNVYLKLCGVRLGNVSSENQEVTDGCLSAC
jgi:hypothetical protein